MVQRGGEGVGPGRQALLWLAQGCSPSVSVRPGGRRRLLRQRSWHQQREHHRLHHQQQLCGLRPCGQLARRPGRCASAHRCKHGARSLSTPCARRTGGIFINHYNFALNSLSLSGNAAYYGAGLFVGTDVTSNATLASLTFLDNVGMLGASVAVPHELARLPCQHASHAFSVCAKVLRSINSRVFIRAPGTAIYWLHSKSPNTPVTCTSCTMVPSSSSALATEALTLQFLVTPPTSIESNQVRLAPAWQQCHACMAAAAAMQFGQMLEPMGALTCTAQAGAPFETGLMDYYGNVAVSESLGGCAARYAGIELELPESGRLANLVNGVGTFSQFSIIGKPRPPDYAAF